MFQPQPEAHRARRTRLRNRLADPRLISWPTFLISSALLSYEIWLYNLVVFALSQVLVFALLAIARWMYLARRFPRRHAWVMITTIVLSSWVGSIVAQLLLAEPNTVVGADGAFTRMIVIPAAGLLSVALIDYRDNVRDLRATAKQLEATRDAGLESLADAREEIVSRLRATLEDSIAELRGGGSSEIAHDLSSLAQDTVRPLSHELAQATPQFAPANAPAQRLRWSAVFSDVASRPLLIPWLMALASALMSIRFTIAQSDEAIGATLTTIGPLTLSADVSSLVTSVSFLLIIFVSMWILTVLATRITRPILANSSGGKRWIVIALSVLGIGIGLQVVLLIVPVLPSPLSDIETDPIGRFLAFLPVVIIALVLAIARTVSFAGASLIEELDATNAELQWEVARIRLDLWAQQRRFAQAIHGPLQAAITASALLLSSKDDDGPSAAIGAAHDRIKSALDNLVIHQDSVIDLTSGLTEIERTWDGVCQVAAQVSPAALELLGQDDICRQATVMVIGESVANAAMHGQATQASVDIEVDPTGYVRVTITDNGTGSADAATAGFGSIILDEACGEWNLVNTTDGAQLTALLAYAPTKPSHSQLSPS